MREGLLHGLNAACGGRVSFLQIGGNDGRIADPLLHWHAAFPWQGTIVEPVPLYFAALSALHRGQDRIRPMECAVSDRDGTLDLWHVAAEAASRYPDWTVGLASTDQQHLIGHGVAPEDCVRVTVPCLTPTQLLARIGAPDRLDLLCVDVEGHEWPILRAFPFDRVEVAVVLLEAWHLRAEDHIRLGFLTHARQLLDTL